MNTAGIISKVTMTLSLDFGGWVIKTPCLFYFSSVKFQCVEETHMMLVAFRRWWKLLQHLRTKDNVRNSCQDLLTTENTADSDWKVHALYYANELLVRVRPSFQKLSQTRQQAETWIRNYQKQVLVMIKHCLRNSQITSIPE